MAILHFHIHYRASDSQKLFIRYQVTGNQSPQILRMQSYDFEHWTGVIELAADQEVAYQYGIDQEAGQELEIGSQRTFSHDGTKSNYFLNDFWRNRNMQNQLFLKTAFTDIALKRHNQKKTKSLATAIDKNQVQFQLNAADIPQNMDVGVIGSGEALGNWVKPLILDDMSYPLWHVAANGFDQHISVEYKYVLVDSISKEIVAWESGANRNIEFTFPAESDQAFVITDEGFRHDQPWWRVAGVAIPVFSLRSNESFGIGEFNDLKHLVDLSVKAGLKMVQVLPINDTMARMNWRDSYPYAAISVYALHPLYLNLDSIGKLGNKRSQSAYQRKRDELNGLDVVDYDQVLKLKLKYLRMLYKQAKETLVAQKEYVQFVKRNRDWLLPYAIFSHLRDLNGTPDFNQWNEHQVFDPSIIKQIGSESYENWDEVQFYLFLQYHADKQLKEAKAYATKHGVILKGDLPIGIYRYSCDAWTAPELFNMSEQAGAPPDDYSALGQNWGFPTYNWEEMSKDGFGWWQKRMQKLAEYFDALRIDHILGFFRIWQVPLSQVQGTMGLFNPRLPMTFGELSRYGLQGDINRYTQPFIRTYYLPELFGESAKMVIETFLDEVFEDAYQMKSEFDTQHKIKVYLDAHTEHESLREGLYRLVSEVLLIEEPGSNGSSYNPRITLQKTYSYDALNPSQQEAITAIYNHYYFDRHDNYWKDQANWKLPALLDATDMLICGEDLGMIPATVPGVMDALNIIPLEIQRMPKGNTTFGMPQQYDYESVCSPSCHDMSTIRGWWEGDEGLAQKFYTEYFRTQGQAPRTCSSEIVEMINRDHLHSKSILAIFPIQDLLGMDDVLKRQDPFAEQINEPSNPDHYWRYRLHLNLDELKEQDDFLIRIRQMIERSGRIVN